MTDKQELVLVSQLLEYLQFVMTSLYVTVAGDFTAKLDEIAEKYQKMGICDGEECNQLRVQVYIHLIVMTTY